jgi:hypothetical protein
MINSLEAKAQNGGKGEKGSKADREKHKHGHGIA